MKSIRIATVCASVALAVGAGPVAAQEPLKIGVLATLEGTYTALGEDGVRGFNVALSQFGGMAGGREIEVIIGATDASPDSAVRAARKVVEQDQVDIVIGPLSGSEGIALRDYSKTQPQVTIINGISGAQETTYVTPSENFFPFQYGRRTVVGRPWRLHLQRERLRDDRYHRRRLFIRLHAGVGPRSRILSGWR